MTTESLQYAVRLCALSACLLLVAASALASNTVIYKWKDKGGRMVYSETPPKSGQATKVGILSVKPIPPAQQQAAVKNLARLKQQAAAEQEHLRLRAADERIDAAILALESAQAELRAGAVPSAGERIENFGGQPALRESYLSRIYALQASVELARQALDEAYAVRRTL